MGYQKLTEIQSIAAFLHGDVYLHLYGLGDLDEFYRPYTTWYGTLEGDNISALALLYHGEHPPVLLGLSRDTDPLRKLLRELLPVLPDEFYAHLSPGTVSVFQDCCRISHHGLHLKMALCDHSFLEGYQSSGIIRLGPADQASLTRFYRESYPNNWFNPRMLETGQYFGVRKGGKLVSAAGIHVYSPAFRVAALGNIATHPDWRGMSLASRVTAHCCRSVLQEVDYVGLNVLAGNASALACYRKLGFEVIAEYHEYTLQKIEKSP